MTPLNNPIEVGMRILVVLNELSPRALGLSQLTYLDYCILHSSDFDGPESLHPKLPAGPGEFGMKRKLIEDGLQLMVRASLIEVRTASDGIVYAATENAAGFIDIFDSKYIEELQERANWVSHTMALVDDLQLAQAMKEIYSKWLREFDPSVVSLTSEEAIDE